jgi:hypothetical protein
MSPAAIALEYLTEVLEASPDLLLRTGKVAPDDLGAVDHTQREVTLPRDALDADTAIALVCCLAHLDHGPDRDRYVAQEVLQRLAPVGSTLTDAQIHRLAVSLHVDDDTVSTAMRGAPPPEK